MTLQAIETDYNGYHFRSRTEARWAVFMDHLNLEYRYEVEGFQLADGVRYLPDFYLPSLGVWLEVKGREPSEDELRKAAALADGTGKLVCICFGDVWPVSDEDEERHLWVSGFDTNNGVILDPYERWTECPTCHKVTFAHKGWRANILCPCDSDSLTPSDRTPRLMAAYEAARGARFEHGENPIPATSVAPNDTWSVIHHDLRVWARGEVLQDARRFLKDEIVRVASTVSHDHWCSPAYHIAALVRQHAALSAALEKEPGKGAFDDL